ncbi:cystathionine beta-lyase [Paenibacillus sp. V4I9]|uniref:MalY/PatB family protein n=1 Tax=Paenibacillus sp. V4I9 TaxID=3042308 RepID=UPI00277D7EF1|nr:PatB family C-S lyase [Paenibacillus sp. V4I9]MDQ0889798.1 cystathionine beta-lyase [Paenibacillus sp. V4I9]
MKYDFDVPVDRGQTSTLKWGMLDKRFGSQDLIPMWVADMEFKVPEPVITALQKRAEHGVFGYTTLPESLYKAVIGWMDRRHGWSVQKEWICHSPGVLPALSLIVQAFTNPGDKIVVQPPVYPPFYKVVKENDREVVLNPLRLDNNRYVMDFDDLCSKIDSSVKMLILCSPHNPIGRVWRSEELKKLGEICLKHNIIVVSDEIHCDLVFKGYKHHPFASISEELSQISITCVSPSKTFNLAGLQSAFVIVPNLALREKLNHIYFRMHLSAINAFAATASEYAYNYGEEWLEQCLDYIYGNLAFIRQFLADKLPQIKLTEQEGTYLAWLDCQSLGMSNEELKRFMVAEAKVAINNGFEFGQGGEGYIRVNTAEPRSLLEEGLLRIRKAVLGMQ